MDRNDVSEKQLRNTETSTRSVPSLLPDVTKNLNNSVYASPPVSQRTGRTWGEAIDHRVAMSSENCCTCNTRFQIPHVKPPFSAMENTFPTPDISAQTRDPWHRCKKGSQSQKEECMSPKKNRSSFKVRCDKRPPRRPNLTMTHLAIAFIVASFLPCYVAALPVNAEKVMYISESESEFRNDNPEVVEVDVEDNDLFAKEFLGKFGYVKPAEWSSVSPRFFVDDVSLDGSDDGYNDRSEGSGEKDENRKDHYIYNSFVDISEEEYERALLKYQRINGLNTTGELDEDTRSYMGRPRCGVPDRTAKVKLNRTLIIQQLETTTTTTVTSSSPDPTTSSQWINHTTNSILTTAASAVGTNLTTKLFDDPGNVTAFPTTTFEPTTSSRNEFTTSSMFDDLSGEGPAESDEHVSSRRRRSMEGQEVEAAFEEVTEPAASTGAPDYYQQSIDVASFPDYFADFRARHLNFKDIGDSPISEAVVPDETRADSLEGILEVLRKEKLSQMNATKSGAFEEMVSSIRPSPAPVVPHLVKRIELESRRERRKRSNAYFYGKTNGWLMAYPKSVITWRLVEEWPTHRPFMTSNEIWFTVKLAFRMWSEVLPRNFREDNVSPMTNVDILLGFGKKEHNRCPVPFFDGSITREYAHAWPLPQAEVHFNDGQPFVSVVWDPTKVSGQAKAVTSYGTPIDLLKVALHEIGHTLGLPHKKDRSSIMNPVYLPYRNKRGTELEAVDRFAIQYVYGACNKPVDAVFDWVQQYVAKDGTIRLKYNTFFFRNTWFWMYENRVSRPKYGEPRYVSDFWRGVLKVKFDPHRKVDGVVNIHDWSIRNGPVYFFTGDVFNEYDNAADKVKTEDSQGRKYPRLIKDGFPNVPYPIDTVFYKWQEKLLYFFKGNYVYKFDWKARKVVSVSTIETTFPGWGGAPPLPNNIDAAYYSYTDTAYYFFKGSDYWKLADERERFYNKGVDIPENAVGRKRLMSSKWRDICDVDETEMQMTLPEKKS